MSLVKVVVEAPLPEPLTYSAPNGASVESLIGKRVSVPLGKRRSLGVVLSKDEGPPPEKLKTIDYIEDYAPLSEPYRRWLDWISYYYMHPPGLVYSMMFPPLPKTTKVRKSQRPDVVPSVAPSIRPQLTEEQLKVIADISANPGFGAHLLFGVTGSGKTEVYLSLLERALSENKKGLVLVPEIALTPQLIQRFSARFGDSVAVIHSQLTEREKTNQWWAMNSGEKQILIGARSALFCPIDDLGIIIVDEEHEPSYKQDEKLKYNGRDCAIMLAQILKIPIVLGSATPSLESWRNTKEGKYHLHRMSRRVEDRRLPDIHVVDLRSKKEENLKYEWLSTELKEAITETLERKEQVALFLNRRGAAHVVLCSDCGYVSECPNCDISLTLHAKKHLVCHYCDYHEDLRLECPNCKEGELKPIGTGTERIEEELSSLFPQARVARADRDEIQGRLDLENLIQKMENHEIDILVGTQMIAKGLDFPKLTLVGLVLADVGFNLPDFRATERSFQLITQVSGRAGRHLDKEDRAGQVIIQTFNPSHSALGFAIHHDYEGFASWEMEHRSSLGYPPSGRLVSFRLQGIQIPRVHEASRILAQRAQKLKSLEVAYKGIEFLGPAEAVLSRLRGNYRMHALVKGSDSKSLLSFCYKLSGDSSWCPSGVKVIVDVDPLHLL